MQNRVQIIHSCSDNCNRCDFGHWICCVYNKESIIIFDSLNSNALNRPQTVFLKKLFPHFDTIPLQFVQVQSQRNNHDRGVLSIAFMTSILLGKNPTKIEYNYEKLRPHLYDMFRTKELKHFPTINENVFVTESVVLPTFIRKEKPCLSRKQNKNIINLTSLEEHNYTFISNDIWLIHGLVNRDHLSCYVNASLQSLLHVPAVRRIFTEIPEDNAFNNAFTNYKSEGAVDIFALKSYAGVQFTAQMQQDATEFITELCDKSNNLSSSLQHIMTKTLRCIKCGDTRITEERPSIIYYCLHYHRGLKVAHYKNSSTIL